MMRDESGYAARYGVDDLFMGSKAILNATEKLRRFADIELLAQFHFLAQTRSHDRR